MADEHVPGELGTCFALIEASLLLQQGVEGVLRVEGGLTFVQFRLLATIAGAPGGMRMTDLADRLVISRSGLTYQADTLEARGLLTRLRSGQDERSVEAAVTPAGRAVVDRILPRYLDTVRGVVLANLSEAEIQEFISALERARNSMRPSGRGNPQPVYAEQGEE